MQSPIMGNEQDMRTFLTTPVAEFLNMDEQVRLSSMEPPSITSLLQGDKTAILHAHLDITGALDSGPIFHDPVLQIPKDKEMHKPFACLSTQGDPSREMLYSKPTYFGQAPMPSHVEREKKAPSVLVPRSNSDDAVKEAMSSTFEFKRAHRHRYT
ncbi:hypothetical protein HU200_046942 [Digitaria exilis]|uniref:Uncharacterized protein n=1 Tax=Digitaria exilis TaxID=1010633 RepID=A0A835B4I8_9POAL|nr:hypothetical protein HU200_046942 [Digitaria exilis]